MKYVLNYRHGMADYPIPQVGNKTPLQAAHKPNMDAIAVGQKPLDKNTSPTN